MCERERGRKREKEPDPLLKPKPQILLGHPVTKIGMNLKGLHSRFKTTYSAVMMNMPLKMYNYVNSTFPAFHSTQGRLQIG